ncbi:MAG TPA: FAD-dependent monooxygenase [Bryobacteraceae bacterium]|jgi:flavin-dependent dehydrogenase
MDVFVVGGGPAGLAAAIAVRRAGMSVVVADGERPPIDKPCGEGLMPDSLIAAARLGLELSESDGYPFLGIRFQSANHSVQADFSGGCGIGIRRTLLHGALIRAAEQAGVEMRWGSPVSRKDTRPARWIIGADGASSLVRRWAGLDAAVATSRRFARRQHFAVAPWSDYVEIHWADGCQAYVTPVSANEVCVALISRSQDLRLEDGLRRFPALAAHLRPDSESTRERGSVTGTVRLRAVARGNVALIGDASGSVDAIAGEGICLSFRQAEVLAKALVKGDLQLYNREHSRLGRRARLLSSVMLQLDRGQFVRRCAMSVLSAQPGIFRRFLDAHTQPV